MAMQMKKTKDNRQDATTVASTDSAINQKHMTGSPDDEEPSVASADIPLIPGGNRKEAQASFVLIRKSTLAFLGILLLFFVVAFGYFFSEWMYEKQFQASRDKANCIMEDELECPFTEADMENLSAEIDRLEYLNRQLSNQLSDYEDLNSQLNASIVELKRQNDILKDSNEHYEDLNARLSETVADLNEHNAFLEGQVDVFENLNQDLNGTVMELKAEVDRLEGQVTNFTLENERLENLVESLSNETDTLSQLSDILQTNIDRLEENVSSLEGENAQLEKSIQDLQSVLSFWGDVSGNYDGTYQQMASFLAQQISTNRFLLLETLQNTYHQRVAAWDCGLRDHFALEDFVQDDDALIPSDKLEGVLNYVDERVLSGICLDRVDFESYIMARYSTTASMTIGKLVTSVQRYTWGAIDYYFPEEGEDGLSSDDWAVAKYNCGNLSALQKYSAQ